MINLFFNNNYLLSYSQSGEDMIVRNLFNTFGIKHPTYLDIGAHDPKKFNNTYHFYINRSRGYLVEPDPELFKKNKKFRPRDVSINAGVGDKNRLATLYIMSTKTLNTFSEKEARNYINTKAYGKQNIVSKIKVPLINIDTLINKHIGYTPDYWSIDTEGFDEEIINSIDYEVYRPKVVCVETARCVTRRRIKKRDRVYKKLTNNNYLVYADTFINTILVDNELWETQYNKLIDR